MWVGVLVLFPALAWLLPGALFSRWLIPRSTPLERAATALLLGVATVVPLTYTVVFLARTPMTPWLVLGAAACVSWGFALALRFAPRPGEPVHETPDRWSESWWIVAAVVAMAVATALSSVPRATDSGQLFKPCLHESCLIMLEDGSGGGLTTYGPRVDGMVTHATARPHEPGYGLSHILGHQRPGSMATMAQGVAFHGSGGLIVMMFLYDLLVALGGALLIARTARRWWLTLLLTPAFLLRVRTLGSYTVNENMLVLGLSLGVLHLAMRRPGSEGRGSDLAHAVVIGVILALTVAVRPAALAMAAGAVVFLSGWRARAAMCATIAVCAVPWLLTNVSTSELWLYHPSLNIGQFEQSFLGLSFRFHPLNWPVADQLMRAGFEPFPNMIRLPLEFQRAFGLAFWVLVMLGLTARWFRARQLLGLAVMAVPNALMLMLVVSLDHEKLSYAVMSAVALPPLAGVGARSLLTTGLSSLPRRAIAGGLAAVFLVGLPLWAGGLTIPVDPRPQYHTTGSAKDQNAARVKERLLTPRWIPGLDPLSTSALDSNWRLLIHGQPPQEAAGTVAVGPVILWLDHDDAVIQAVAKPMNGSALARLLEGRDNGCNPERGFAGASFYLEGVDKTVEVQAVISRGTLRIELNRGGGGSGAGFLTLGIHNDQVEELTQVEVLLDGSPLPLHLVVLEEQAGRTLRVVSNYAWHYEYAAGTPHPVAGPAPEAACAVWQSGSIRVARTPQYLSLRPAHGPACRFLTLASLGGAAPANACR